MRILVLSKQSAVSSQRSALWHRLWPWPKGHATRLATLCERRWEVTQIKRMLTCLIQKLFGVACP
ncbi:MULTISPECIES: hypothetical protein [unclassified Moorena]|uniref:hypothetical protein n=1 Tax=unclassified Moorena TaxID=2683338 RepID=UPI0013C955FD|nr:MULTISPECIES: hypothetical protein [unclassified Moorena]NEO18517.1 hypothetical protein [Moorena sp. SIO4A5]NEQ59045.1 hypothetical protein [Moorena sp. SIO4A1]